MDRIDIRSRDELLKLDHVGVIAGGGIDLVLREHHVLAAADLVALGHLLVGHLFALLGAHAALLDLGAVLGVHLTEMHGLVLDCRVDLDRHRGEAERDRAVPDRAGHR